MSDNIDKLPNPSELCIEEIKIRQYLLNIDHPQGGPKANFFLRRGFSLDDWLRFKAALAVQGSTNTVVRIVDHQYGRRFTVECTCETPDEVNPCIRSVWQIDCGDTIPRLIIAHPIS